MRLLKETEDAAALGRPSPRDVYADAVQQDNCDEAAIVAGESAALVDGVIPAAQVVEEMVREADTILGGPSPFSM